MTKAQRVDMLTGLFPDRPTACLVNLAAGILAPSRAVTSQSFLMTVSMMLTQAEVVMFRLGGMCQAHSCWGILQPSKSGTVLMLLRPTVASKGVEPFKLKRK
jgi:hypothetical protein